MNLEITISVAFRFKRILYMVQQIRISLQTTISLAASLSS